MKAYVFLGLFLVVGLMIAGCAPKLECGDGICSASIGENYQNCAADCPAPAKGVGAKLSVVPATTTVSNGDTVTLEIRVADVSNLFGFQFDINYDSSILEFQKVGKGAMLETGGGDSFCVPNEPSPGLVRNIACTKLGGKGVDGSGVLATVTFTAISTGKSSVSLTNAKLADSNAEKMAVSVSNGEVVVE